LNEKKHPQRSMPDGTRSADLDPCFISRIPLNMTQKTTARRMLQSARDIPQFSVSMELNADELAALRSRINSDIEDEQSRVSLTALMIWLTARALLKHARLNARFDQDAIIQHDTVNMAVAIDTPQGLTAPVIHRAETLSVHETAVALKDLVTRATGKRLSMSDFKDGTFTISNLGMLGVTRFTPLINPPQAAIMGVSAPRETVQTDADGALLPARMMEVTVTADHRILDGAQVARFLQTLRDSVTEIDAGEGWKPSGRTPAGTEGESG
jgi:pyruvate dehydrogenase E2 component (dihydrolipoamide acetyltransferase)